MGKSPLFVLSWIQALKNYLLFSQLFGFSITAMYVVIIIVLLLLLLNGTV